MHIQVCNTEAERTLKMSISTFNFEFYNYKLPEAIPLKPAKSFSDLEMDIDEEEVMLSPSITSTPLSTARLFSRPPTPRFTSELTLSISDPDVNKTTPLQALRPQLHKPQKRWSIELREKAVEMSKRNNGFDEDARPSRTATNSANMQQRSVQQLEQEREQEQEQEQVQVQVCNATFNVGHVPEDANSGVEVTRSVSDKINFFNTLTNTYESTRNTNNYNSNANRFISLLRSSRPMGMATTSGAGGLVPPPKPKRLGATTAGTNVSQHQFATPNAKATTGHSHGNSNNNINGNGNSNGNGNMIQRKTSLRRKPSMDKSRATISRQSSNATLRPQRHAIMEDLSLVVPVRLRIAEYEQRISMSG